MREMGLQGNSCGFSKIIILFILLFSALVPLYGQNANMVRQWDLSSVEIKETANNNSEIIINYEDAKGFINCIFDEIELEPDYQCRIRRQDEVLKTKYTIKHDLLTINFNGEEFIYNYEFDGTLILETDFIRQHNNGEKVVYNIIMKYNTY